MAAPKESVVHGSQASQHPSDTPDPDHELVQPQQLPALDRLALLVRGADTARPDLAPEAAGLLAADFPGGVGAGARIAVAQWGEGYGWGTEAVARLI